MTLDRLPFRVAQALLLVAVTLGALLYGYIALALLTLPQDARGVALTIFAFAIAATCTATLLALGCAVSQGYFRWRGRTF